MIMIGSIVTGLLLTGYFVWRIFEGNKYLKLTTDKNNRDAIIATMFMRGILALMIVGALLLTYGCC